MLAADQDGKGALGDDLRQALPHALRHVLRRAEILERGQGVDAAFAGLAVGFNIIALQHGGGGQQGVRALVRALLPGGGPVIGHGKNVIPGIVLGA
jgi:hypothetical protein